jgi:hypothetical protein
MTRPGSLGNVTVDTESHGAHASRASLSRLEHVGSLTRDDEHRHELRNTRPAAEHNDKRSAGETMTRGLSALEGGEDVNGEQPGTPAPAEARPIIPEAPRVKTDSGRSLVLFGGVPTIKAKRAKK